MKKNVRYILLMVLGGIGTVLVVRTVSGVRHKNAIVAAISRLPSLRLPLANGGEADIRSLAGSHPSVVIYFSPDCEHCQYEAKAIKKNLPALQKAEILLITRAQAAEARLFAEEYKLDGLPNVCFLSDPEDDFYKTFGTHQFPSIFIYDKNHRLIKKFTGETKMEAIIGNLK